MISMWYLFGNGLTTIIADLTHLSDCIHCLSYDACLAPKSRFYFSLNLSIVFIMNKCSKSYHPLSFEIPSRGNQMWLSLSDSLVDFYSSRRDMNFSF